MTSHRFSAARFAAAALALAVAPAAFAIDPFLYDYAGDATPNTGTYGNWFTTVGAGVHGYFPATSWNSDGNILTINTVYPGNGIWFGRISGTADSTATLTFGNTSEGNWVSSRLRLSVGATDWSLYWHDTSGKGAALEFDAGSLTFFTSATAGGPSVGTSVALDLTQFQTITSYVRDAQVHYWVNGAYLGGGHAGTGGVNTLLLGDSTGSTPTGTGSMQVDFLRVSRASGATPPHPIAVPEPAAAAGLAGLAALGCAALRRRPRA